MNFTVCAEAGDTYVFYCKFSLRVHTHLLLAS